MKTYSQHLKRSHLHTSTGGQGCFFLRCCQGCGETVTYGTLAQHLRSQQHFAGLMLHALGDDSTGNPQDGETWSFSFQGEGKE